MIRAKQGPYCSVCPLYRSGVPVYDAAPNSNEWSGVALVGEMPGMNEVREKQPFVGMSGELLKAWCSMLGVKREDFYITNAQRCGLPGGRKLPKKETEIAVDCCSHVLFGNLDEIRPKVVVALGGIPWKALSGIDTIVPYRGCVLDRESEDDYYVMATFHPAYVLRVPTVADVVGTDLEKAIQLAKGEVQYWVPEILPATFENVMKLLDDAFAVHGPLTIDVETDSVDALEANLKTIGLSFDGRGLSVPFPPIANYYTHEQLAAIKNRLREYLTDERMQAVFHNMAYDVPVLERCL